MIDIYLKDKSLNCESKINECLEYYQSLDYEDYQYIYDEYDRIEKIRPKIDKDETNTFLVTGSNSSIYVSLAIPYFLTLQNKSSSSIPQFQ